MLSYQHRYHAGGFADVHKHIVLAAILNLLGKKESGFAFLDTHAGEGVYDLTSAEAVKVGEAANGILRLIAAPAPPPAVAGYLDCVRAENPGGGLRRYPGSPQVALRLSRPQDELILIEKHPQAIAHLKRNFRGSPRAHVHDRDALEALVALVPPRQRRGVALIDPSYEDKEEYRTVAQAFLKAHARWPQGIYILWYPILPANRHKSLIDAIVKNAILSILRSEWQLKTTDREQGLQGSGLLIVNPPWRLDEDLTAIGQWLTRIGFSARPFTLDRLGGT